MNDDYLWDGSGEPDPEVQRLEHALARYRHEPRDTPFPHASPLSRLESVPDVTAGSDVQIRAAKRTHRLGALAGVMGIAAAAALIVALGGIALWIRASSPTVEVARLEGAPTIGARVVSSRGRLSIGEHLTTDGVSRARIDVGLIGQVVVEPGSRLALAAARATEQRLSLELGTIRARIWAPPGLFRVDVPSALAVDMGCAYTLTVDPSEAGLLRVTQGWVAFTHAGRESFVPQGAVCRTRPGVGPGTPYREDASETLAASLSLLDFEPDAAPEARSAALDRLLAASRPRDALTLWHLLGRLPPSERDRVYTRLAELVPPPDGVTRSGILTGDRRMLDLWWDELGLNSASFWRRWEGAWPLDAR